RALRSGLVNRELRFAAFPTATWPSERPGLMDGRKRGNQRPVVVTHSSPACPGTEAFALRSHSSGLNREHYRKECRTLQATRSFRHKNPVFPRESKTGSPIARPRLSVHASQSLGRLVFAK